MNLYEAIKKSEPEIDSKCREDVEAVKADIINFLKSKGAKISSFYRGVEWVLKFDLSNSLLPLFRKYYPLTRSMVYKVGSFKEDYSHRVYDAFGEFEFNGEFEIYFEALHKYEYGDRVKKSDLNEVYFEYSIELPTVWKEYAYSLGLSLECYNLFDNSDGLEEIKSEVEVFKQTVETILSIDGNDYEQYLKDKIQVYEEKLQKRADRLKAKRDKLNSELKER